MLKSIEIENFKAFANLQKLNLSPITLIYGANSSGKSSIIHSLMVLKQSILFPNLKGGIYSDKRILDVGSYETMVYSHNLKNDIIFGLDFDKGVKFNIIYNYIDNDLKKGGSQIDGFSCIKKISVNSYLNDFIYYFENNFNGDDNNDTKDFDFKVNDLSKTNFDKIKDKKILQEILSSFVFSAEDDFPIPKGVSINSEKHLKLWRILKEKEIQDELYDVYQYINNNISMDSNVLKDNLKKISYLGPLRSNPKRYYSVDSEFEASVGKEGENIAFFLKTNTPSLSLSINDWFAKFEIPYQFRPIKIGGRNSEPLIQIELKDRRNNVTVSPLDVGFGIGQILPIIIEGLIRKESIICVEQPEIHLHPKLQAELAEFFVETCNKNQWIIETHSEALMLRIQKIIRSKKKVNGSILRPEDVTILYVLPSKNSDEGAQVVQIRLDEEGDFIDFWPEGFFEERIKERR